jgi:prefoldin subunit 5
MSCRDHCKRGEQVEILKKGIKALQEELEILKEDMEECREHSSNVSTLSV